MTGLAFQDKQKNSFKSQRVGNARGILRILKNHRDCDTTYKQGGDFWIGLFKQLDVIGRCSLDKTPCGRFFQQMLIDFPARSGLDAGSVVRSVAGLDYQGKKTLLFYLSQLFDTAYAKSRFTDNQCEAQLNRIKVQAFLQNYDAERLSNLSDQDQYEVFMDCLSMAPDTKAIRNARVRFYQSMRVPAALEDYLDNARKTLCAHIDEIRHPEKMAVILSCMRGFCDEAESKEDLAYHLIHLIAETHRIPVPCLNPNEYQDEGVAACWSGAPDTLQSTIQYKFSALQTREAVICVTFHEVAGHAVESMLSRRSHEQAWNALDAGFQRGYPMLDPASGLGRAALMLAFNNQANHARGYYFPCEDSEDSYRAQLTEKFAEIAEIQSGKICTEKLNRLNEAVDIFRSLKEKTKESLIRDIANCHRFIMKLDDADLKDFVCDSMEELRHLLDNVDCCESPAYRLQYIGVISDLSVLCSDSSGYAGHLFLSKIENSLRENNHRHSMLSYYPIESLRQLLVELDKLDGRNAFFEECETFMLPPVRHPEAIPA